jgi:UDP:flavonoid glycosyltransferase YjiC (YdhE family)
MKKFLFTTLPSNDLGLLTRSLPIARELRDRGHEITFCSPGKTPSRLISDAGFSNLLPEWPLFYIMSGDTKLQSFYRLLRSKHLMRDCRLFASFLRHTLQSSTAEIWNIDHFTYLLGMSNENGVRAAVGSLMDLISAYEPDVIVDFWNPFACIAARASRKPLITVIQADMHPLSRGFIWWKQPPSKLPTPVPIINSILSEFHLEPIKKTGELFVGDKTLVVGIPETDPLPDTADVTYIGPILWQRTDEKLPDWVAALSDERPVVWVYPGNPSYVSGSKSPFDSIIVLQACIEALKDMPIQVVLSTGHHSLPKSAHNLPPNFRHASFVPGLVMAERSDLLIHHGGYGSCQTGLFTGTPAVIIPTFSERESNARRIASVGAGDFVLPTTDSSGRKKQVQATEVRSKVKHVLSNSAFKENAKRISEKIRHYGGAPDAARLIENFI